MMITNLRLVLCATLFFCSGIHAQDKSTAPPNVLIIISDDLGWRDVGYHGSEIKTPHLDKLARTGVRLERHYVYPTCSPTRAGILSGRNPSRYGIHGPIDLRSTQSLPFETLTLARLLQKRGYSTGMIGKWHLGLRPAVGPRQFGYDFSYGYFHGQIDPYTHLYKTGDKTWHRNDEFVEEKGHVTDLIADEGVRFLQAERTKPFFLWVAFAAPHYPIVEEEKWLAPYKNTIADPSRRLYAGCVSHMDDAIGRLVGALEKSKQLDNTLILFTSDNGGFEKYQSKKDYGGKYEHTKLGDNAPLRGWKGGLFEGGVRVPALANWPGKLAPAVAEETVSMLDWYPTVAKLAGTEVPVSAKLEGRDVWPILTRAQQKPADPILYWNIIRQKAVLHDGWKLIVDAKQPALVELYNLREDPGEARNISAANPDKVASLRQEIERERKLDAP